MTRHVVFGTGQIGRLTTRQLIDQATPLDHALATTLRWYRDRTASHQAA